MMLSRIVNVAVVAVAFDVWKMPDEPNGAPVDDAFR